MSRCGVACGYGMFLKIALLCTANRKINAHKRNSFCKKNMIHLPVQTYLYFNPHCTFHSFTQMVISQLKLTTVTRHTTGNNVHKMNY